MLSLHSPASLTPWSLLWKATHAVAVPDQIILRTDKERLDLARENLAAVRARNTHLAYEADWNRWDRWCASQGTCPLPAAPAALALYLSDASETHRPGTLKRWTASISKRHQLAHLESPATSPEVREMLAGISKRKGNKRRHAQPILRNTLVAIATHLDPSNPRDQRDRAILLLGWSIAARESELVALDLDNVHQVERGMEVYIARSKTDQTGEGRTVPVAYARALALCPVLAVRAWRQTLETLAPPAGPLFRSLRCFQGQWSAGERLAPRAIEDTIRRLARRAGLEGFGGHSLRAGFATEGSKELPDREIMRVTGHKSRSTLDYYIDQGQLWDHAPALL